MRAAAFAVVLLGGCTVGPDFGRPSIWSPALWFGTRRQADACLLEASMPTAEPGDPEWQRAFRDPVLTGLVRRAAAGNLDVRAATFRLAQSRAQRGIAAADQFPQVNGNASHTRERISSRGVSGLFGGSASDGGTPSAASQSGGLGGRQGGFPSPSSIPDFDLFQGGFDATWELDLWGRVRRSVESADATLDASTEARRATLLSTIADSRRPGHRPGRRQCPGAARGDGRRHSATGAAGGDPDQRDRAAAWRAPGSAAN